MDKDISCQEHPYRKTSCKNWKGFINIRELMCLGFRLWWPLMLEWNPRDFGQDPLTSRCWATIHPMHQAKHLWLHWALRRLLHFSELLLKYLLWSFHSCKIMLGVKAPLQSLLGVSTIQPLDGGLWHDQTRNINIFDTEIQLLVQQMTVPGLIHMAFARSL